MATDYKNNLVLYDPAVMSSSITQFVPYFLLTCLKWERKNDVETQTLAWEL